MALLRASPVPARMLRQRAALTPRPSTQARSLVVGRDPAMQELALTVAITAPIADLSHAAPRDAFDRMRAKFPTAAIAVFEFPGNWDQLDLGAARLTLFATPGTWCVIAAPVNGHRADRDSWLPRPVWLSRRSRKITALNGLSPSPEIGG